MIDNSRPSKKCQIDAISYLENLDIANDLALLTHTQTPTHAGNDVTPQQIRITSKLKDQPGKE